MAEVNVKGIGASGDSWVFDVNIRDSKGTSKHMVSLKKDIYQMLTDGKVDPEELVKISFIFLLKREPKESILPEFELELIKRYFSNFEDIIKEKFV